MSSVVRTRIDPILLAIQQQIMAVTGFPAERALIVDPEDLPFKPQGDQFCCTWLMDGDWDLPILEGGGRVDARLRETVAVTLYTRFGTDVATSGLSWLTDASLGHAFWRHQILDALVLFQPTDANGNWLCSQPLVPRSTRRPRRERDEKNWGSSTVAFLVEYEAALSQSYQ
jgi:hypothetical protein